MSSPLRRGISNKIIAVSKEENKNILHPYWITGFIDGEGSFSLILSKNNTYKLGWLVFPVFQITLHTRDRAILEDIKIHFQGVGSIFCEEKRNSVKYRVASFKELGIIIEHLDKYPLITQKQADFLLFKRAWILINNKVHLTLEGLNQIVNIRAAMNKGLTDTLIREFPDYIPMIRPLIQDRNILDSNWLAGFTTAEGHFGVKIEKSISHKRGTRVILVFVLTQHIRDKNLMKSIISYLGCGRYSFAASRPDSAMFTVSKFKDNYEIIIPFFDKYPIRGVKHKDFLIFSKVAQMINNKDHLTKDGYEQILVLRQEKTNNGRRQEDEDSSSIISLPSPDTLEGLGGELVSYNKETSYDFLKIQKRVVSSETDNSVYYPAVQNTTVRTVITKGYSKSSLPLINREDYEILYGLILGDLFISRKNNENALMRFEQSIIHKEYLEHLFEKFKYLCTASASIKTAERKTFDTSSVYFTTRQLTSITELHKLFYIEGKKIVPLNIGSLLTEKSLAYWAMDDGDNHKSGYILNTSGFTLEDVKVLQAVLYDNWELETSIHSRNRLYIRSSSINKFLSLIRPHFHNSMLYKIV